MSAADRSDERSDPHADARVDLRVDARGPARTHARRRPSLKDHSRAALRALFGARGWPAYRADQVANWLYQQDATRLDQMTNLPAGLRGEIEAEFEVDTLEVVLTQQLRRRHAEAPAARARRRADRGGADPRRASAHALRLDPGRLSARPARFCATGALGFTRNLSRRRDRRSGLPHARRRIPAGERRSRTSSSWAWASRC